MEEEKPAADDLRGRFTTPTKPVASKPQLPEAAHLARCRDALQAGPSEPPATEAPEAQANAKSNGGNGELRSSSGECTSGESKTEKEGETFRGGSLKDSGSHAGTADENKTGENKSGSAEGSDDGKKADSRSKDDVTNATNDEETQPSAGKQTGTKKKPKLPRPEVTPPCPRCSSDDTKFCYYNNYNIKQPRYFCKSCQRYWTEGGMLRNVPVGAGRRSKVAKDKKGDKVAPPVMANPLGPPLTAAGAYAHNRHVLWDGADPLGHAYSSKGRSDPYSGIPSGYMHGGPPHGMHMPSRGVWHPMPGSISGSDRTANFSNGGSSNMSTRSYAGAQQDIISTDAAGTGNGSTVDMSGSGGADSPDGRGRFKIRKPNAESGAGMHADYNQQSGMMPSSNSGSMKYDYPQGGHGYGRRNSEDGNQDNTPISSSAMMDLQGQGEGPWMMHPPYPAAAAAAAAYQSPYWSNMPRWNYHWGNNAVAGWAAAAAAVYQAGANSPCWPSNGSWNPMDSSSITPGAPMGSGPNSMMQHPGMPPHQGQHYPGGGSVQGGCYPGGPMMGYPGPSGPWSSPHSNMPMMHQRMQGQGPPHGAVSGIPHHPYAVAQQMVTPNGHRSSSQSMLGKHVRSYD